MIRKIVLATGMAMGLLGMDLTASEAKADNFAFSINGRNFGIGYSNYNYGPAYYGPAYAPAYAPAYPTYVAPVHHYHVYYRDCKWEPWRLHGSYYSHGQAHAAANRLEWRGYDARVNHH